MRRPRLGVFDGQGRAQSNTAGMTFLKLDWPNRSAATATCTGCGRIEWFLADPEELPDAG
ncbi:MAG TPA: hypothetical protein VGQ44_21990 [Gemmatimonadaceae bacterium]|nr:hypothetical protein [Gemmatimonadaceae bacterium]